jgi:hypothetical protein
MQPQSTQRRLTPSKSRWANQRPTSWQAWHQTTHRTGWLSRRRLLRRLCSWLPTQLPSSPESICLSTAARPSGESPGPLTLKANPGTLKFRLTPCWVNLPSRENPCQSFFMGKNGKSLWVPSPDGHLQDAKLSMQCWVLQDVWCGFEIAVVIMKRLVRACSEGLYTFFLDRD